MPSDTPSSSALRGQVSRLEVVSVGARQRWTPERKRELVLETFEPGAKVNAVARRNGVAASQLFAWRKQMREELAEAGVAAPAPRFLPLAIAAPASPTAIEIETPGGVRMKFSGAVAADLIVALVKALTRR